MMYQRRLVALAMLVLCSFLATTSTVPAMGQVAGTGAWSIGVSLFGTCHTVAPCGGGVKCIPIPTSLRAVDVSTSVNSGWETVGGHCGVKRCFVFFVVPCGNPLGSATCN